jgi:hypothetical protein
MRLTALLPPPPTPTTFILAVSTGANEKELLQRTAAWRRRGWLRHPPRWGPRGGRAGMWRSVAADEVEGAIWVRGEWGWGEGGAEGRKAEGICLVCSVLLRSRVLGKFGGFCPGQFFSIIQTFYYFSLIYIMRFQLILNE